MAWKSTDIAPTETVKTVLTGTKGVCKGVRLGRLASREAVEPASVGVWGSSEGATGCTQKDG